MSIEVKPIGYIKSPYKIGSNIPRQALLNKEKEGIIYIKDEYLEGIAGLKNDDYIEIIFHFNQSNKEPLTITSRKNGKVSGVFATRAPHRPNHLGISIVKIVDIIDDKIKFKGVDMVDGTPVIDIKPFNDGLLIKD